MTSKFKVWCPAWDQPETAALEIEACGVVHAAELWAAHEDKKNSRYFIAAGRHVAVLVRRVESGYTTEVIVTGEVVPTYHGTMVVKENSDD